jgi:hypothetical protein
MIIVNFGTLQFCSPMYVLQVYIRLPHSGGEIKKWCYYSLHNLISAMLNELITGITSSHFTLRLDVDVFPQNCLYYFRRFSKHRRTAGDILEVLQSELEI